MTSLSITRRSLLATSFGAALVGGQALAAYPERPLRWLVGFPPGGGTDTLARLLAQSMAPRFGQPVLIENRPGATASLAAEALAKSAPDGQTAMAIDTGALIINPVVFRSVAYDSDRDFRPVGLYAGLRFLLAVRSDSPLRSATEYLDKAKASAEPINYATPGIGSPLHLAMERLSREAGVRLTHVPYRGAAPALNDVLAGAVSSIAIDYMTAAEMIRAGRIRPLAMFSEERLPALAQVPTMGEQGLPRFVADTWHGMIVPRATPNAIVERLSGLLGEALAEPSVRARYNDLGVDIMPTDTETFAQRWQSDKAILQPLIRSLGITVDS